MKAAKIYVPYRRSALRSSTRTEYVAIPKASARYARVSLKSSTELLRVVSDRRRAEFLGAGIDLLRAIKWQRHAPLSPYSSVLPVDQAIINFIEQADLNSDFVIDIPDDLRGKISDLRDRLHWVSDTRVGFAGPLGFWAGVLQMVIAGVIVGVIIIGVSKIIEGYSDDEGEDEDEGDDDDGDTDSGSDADDEFDTWRGPGEGWYERSPISRDLLIQLVDRLGRITR